MHAYLIPRIVQRGDVLVIVLLQLGTFVLEGGRQKATLHRPRPRFQMHRLHKLKALQACVARSALQLGEHVSVRSLRLTQRLETQRALCTNGRRVTQHMSISGKCMKDLTAYRVSVSALLCPLEQAGGVRHHNRNKYIL